MRFVCSFWIIGLRCCFAQERSPSGLEPVGLSLSLHCSEWLGTLHSTTLGISTIFSIALFRSPVALVLSLRLGMFFSPAVGCALLLSWVLGSLPWLFFRLSPSMPALPVRDIGAAVPAGTAHLVRPCFQGLPDQRLSRRPCDRAPWSCSAIEVSWFMTPISSWLLFVARLQLRTLDFCSRHCISDLVPRGRRAVLDQFRTV